MKRPVAVVSALAEAVYSRIAGKRRQQPQQAGFPVWDERFHASYARFRDAAAHAGPVLVLLGDSLILLDGERRIELLANAPANRTLKAAAHIPVGVFTTLEQRRERASEPLDEHTARRLRELQYLPACGAQELAGLDADVRVEVEAVLDKSRAFVDAVLAQNGCRAPELAQFAADIGPALLRLIERATLLELDALHAAVEDVVQRLSAEERQQLEVVVAGAHQARARNLGLQYFKLRFGEEPDHDARVTYAESATDEQQARALVGTRRVDRAIAAAFFGDSNRMQRDLLGDAAARALSRVQLARIA